jgi:4-hydroxy-2-oxoheptanedioate aldolase
MTKFGLFIKCPHPEIIECLGIEKSDFAVVDMEHTPVSQSNLYPLVLAADLHNLELIVRIPENNESYYKWCLDLGVRTIQIPHVQSVDNVLSAVKYSNFSPIGERGLCRFVRAAKYSSLDKDTYIKEANKSKKLIFQIEGEEGVKNIDSIIDSLPENSALFIGPYDLSQSLGIPGKIWDQAVLSKMKDIIAKCKKSNVEIGTFTDSEEGINIWSDLEVDFIEYSSDLNIFMHGVKSVRNIFNNALKNKMLKFGDNYQ